MTINGSDFARLRDALSKAFNDDGRVELEGITVRMHGYSVHGFERDDDKPHHPITAAHVQLDLLVSAEPIDERRRS